MFHFGSSEIFFAESEFAERNAASTCIRDIVRLAKEALEAEEYHKMSEDELIPVITRGLGIKNDRVQSEFIQVCSLYQSNGLKQV